MNLRDLHYLVALAEHGHFGQAAQACHVSQPTLSTQIKKLEDELGVVLIERSSRQLLFTDAGRRIARLARQVLATVEEMRAVAEEYADPEAGRLRLGVIPTVAPYLLPLALPELRRRFPRLQIYLFEWQTAVLLERLPAGELDAALLALPIDPPHPLDTLPLFDEPFLAALPAGHPLARRPSLPLEAMRETDVLLLEDGHCLRDQALDLCKRVGAAEVEGFRATSLETLRQMVAMGMGATFVPALAAFGRHEEDGIVYRPFEPPVPYRSLVLALRPACPRRALLERLAEAVRRTGEAALAG